LALALDLLFGLALTLTLLRFVGDFFLRYCPCSFLWSVDLDDGFDVERFSISSFGSVAADEVLVLVAVVSVIVDVSD